MGRKEELENHIRESCDLIRQYETIIRETDRPKERKRARRIIDEQWELIKYYLDEYLPLCRRLGATIPDDIAQVAARFDDGVPGGTTLATSQVGAEQPQTPTRLVEVPSQQAGLICSVVGQRSLEAGVI